MKYYIIYKDDIFVGYTTSFEMLQIFLHNRKPIKYMVRIFNEKDISKKILNNNLLSEYELSYYQGYYTTYELPVFEYEREILNESLYEFTCSLFTDVSVLLKYIEYIKFDSKEEKKEIKTLLSIIINELVYITESSEECYGETIDIPKYFMKYIVNKKIN